MPAAAAMSLAWVATVLTACGIETTSFMPNILPGSPVATVLTACGIETMYQNIVDGDEVLQQCLPLAVLKLNLLRDTMSTFTVATVLTACGIETGVRPVFRDDFGGVATVLTACGIETLL